MGPSRKRLAGQTTGLAWSSRSRDTLTRSAAQPPNAFLIRSHNDSGAPDDCCSGGSGGELGGVAASGGELGGVAASGVGSIGGCAGLVPGSRLSSSRMGTLLCVVG